MCFSFKKPDKLSLADQQYFRDYQVEMSRPDDHIKVYRGLDSEVPEVRGSLRGSLRDSILQKLSWGSNSGRGAPSGADQRGLLNEEESVEMDELEEINIHF